MTDHHSTHQLVSGLEIHAELKTDSKMFCGCKNDPFHAEKPNLHTCPVCLGMPGGLPVANRKAIEWTIKLGLALNCKINLFSKFDRKHYFYPDLAKGYQISQYDLPFCYDGYLDTSEGRVGITRIHLEEDTGKLIHTKLDGKKVSLVDFNRSGVPLLELVTEPDIKTPSQAAEFGRKIRQIIRYLNIGDADMQKGGMRLEANISLSPDETLPDYKVELKNINSFRYMEQAMDYEVERQEKLLKAGKTPAQETRGWDTAQEKTFPQRTKEEAADYRYFPDPDIPPLQLTKEQVNTWRDKLPDLPTVVLERWQEKWGLEKRYAQHLIKNVRQTKLLDALFSKSKRKKMTPNDFAKEIVNKNLSFKLKDKPKEIITRFKALHKTEAVETDVLTATIKQVLNENQDAVEKYQAGKTQVIGFLMGQVAQKINKKIDMKLVRNKLQQALEA